MRAAHKGPYTAASRHLDAQRNFETFGNAVLLLFQCLTGDGWSYLMHEAMVKESWGRHCSETEGNCGTLLAVPYFVSFQAIGSVIAT